MMKTFNVTVFYTYKQKYCYKISKKPIFDFIEFKVMSKISKYTSLFRNNILIRKVTFIF